MIKTKINCFYYMRHNDVYVSNVIFSNDKLLSLLNIFFDGKVFVLIELDLNCVQTLSLICKTIGITDVKSNNKESRFIMVCSKAELLLLLKQTNMNCIEGIFVANINKEIVLSEYMQSLEYTTNSMVKKGSFDISISINFPENQMVISSRKGKYNVAYIKETIRRWLGQSGDGSVIDG